MHLGFLKDDDNRSESGSAPSGSMHNDSIPGHSHELYQSTGFTSSSPLDETSNYNEQYPRFSWFVIKLTVISALGESMVLPVCCE